MSKTICPGQDTMFWKPGDVFEVPCGACGEGVEFFKDDTRRRCHACGNLVQNPKFSLGCAQWCEHAKECLGFDPKERMAEAEGGDESLVDGLIREMKQVFKEDQKRITHALRVLHYAQEILKNEKADPKVVLAAAVLHDIGILEAEKKHRSNAGRFQEMEGPAIAEPILKKSGLNQEDIDHVLAIIANHHSARDIDTPEFRILWDADWLVNLPDVHGGKDKEALARIIPKLMKTPTGERMALGIYAA